MTTAELLLPDAESLLEPSDAVYRDILERRAKLDANHDIMHDYDVAAAERQEMPTAGRHRMVTFDLSKNPGGAFKYLSALGGALNMPEGSTAVTVTAGNYGSTLAEACARIGAPSIAYTPTALNEVKRDNMAAQGMDVRAVLDNVQDGVPTIKKLCEQTDGWTFLHAYDNPDGIAALTHYGDQVLNGLYEMEAIGQLDLQCDRVEILVQRGGGSLITALAVSLRRARELGWVGDNVVIREVRPELHEGGLDPMFDGLKVDKPGENAGALLADKAYVQDTVEISRAAVADAARLVTDQKHQTHEANSVAGVAAALQLGRQTDHRTTYVALLTGRNMTDEQQAFWMSHPGLAQVETQRRAEQAAWRRAQAELARSAFINQVSAPYAARKVAGLEEIIATNGGGQQPVAKNYRLRHSLGAPCLSGAVVKQ